MSSEKPTEAIVVNFPNTEHPLEGLKMGVLMTLRRSLLRRKLDA